MSEYLDIKKAAELFGWTRRHVCRLCEDGNLPGAVKVGGHWKIPRTADPRLAMPENLPNLNELHNIPANKRDEALRCLGVIRDFERFVDAFAGKRSGALAIYVTQEKVTKRSLERWMAKYRTQGLLGLVDTRGGGKFISDMISDEAFELFKSMYLTQQRLSVKTCWQNICFKNKDEQKGWKIPSLQFMYRYIKNQIPLSVQILHREGLNAYVAKCAPYIETDPDSVAPGQIWVGDHSQFNCWVRHRGKWIRPWVTAWQDMRSRTIVGFHISASPNQTTILLAMKRAIEKYGPPDSVKIDNGKDYDSECWTGTTKVKRRTLKRGYIDEQMVAGIYAMMDVGVSFAIKYHPQSKPLERWFDTLDKQFTKTIPTYCGKDTDRKPDYLNDLLKSEKAIKEAHDLAGFAETVGQYVEVYNHSAHTGRGMNNKSPAQVLETRQSRRVMVEGVADLLLRVWSGELTIGKNGVRLKGMWYGQYDMQLAIHQGKKVRVAYDPDDLRRVYVYDAATLKLITIAEQNQLVQYGSAVSEEAFRTATQQKARALKVTRQFRDSRLAANMDLTSLTLRAMQEGQKEVTEKSREKTLRPVRTPLDSQVREHERREIIKAVKKAAGAESLEAVLDCDFSLLKPENKYADVNLFDE